MRHEVEGAGALAFHTRLARTVARSWQQPATIACRRCPIAQIARLAGQAAEQDLALIRRGADEVDVDVAVEHAGRPLG
jgi:hypothetical protein